jgi:hypothetical protein
MSPGAPPAMALRPHGEVAEWLKAHAWKVCIRQNRIGGSNPPLSAIAFSYLYDFT